MQNDEPIIQEEELLEHIGKELHRLRSENKDKLDKIASAVGVSHPVISNIENGRYPNVKLVLLVKLANYFKVPLQQFIPLDKTQVINYNQHNNEGSQHNVQIKNELKEGYLLCIDHQKDEIAFLRAQLIAKG